MPRHSLHALLATGSLAACAAALPAQRVSKSPPAQAPAAGAPTARPESAAPPRDSVRVPVATLQRATADSVRRVVLDSVAGALAAAARQKAAADSAKTAEPRSCGVIRPLAQGRRPIPHCVSLVEIFADGNVKDVLGGGKAAATPSGALGLHYMGSRYEVSGLVNVAGANDTVRRPFGHAVLVPAAGKALNAAALNIRYSLHDWGDRVCAAYDYPLSCNFGLRVHADASTRVWATRTHRVAAPASPVADTSKKPVGQQGGTVAAAGDSIDRVTETTEVPSWGVGADVSYTFFQAAITGSDNVSRPVQMVLDLGLVRRAIRGDIAGHTRDAQRDSLLGTRRTHFDGLEVGLSMIYDKIRTSFTYARLNGGVDGLSGGQIVAAVDLRAALASGLLKRD